MASEKELKILEQIIKHKRKFNVKTDANDFTLDAVDGSSKNTADVLASLLGVLKKQGIIE